MRVNLPSKTRDSDVAAMCNTCNQSRPKSQLTQHLLESFGAPTEETLRHCPPRLLEAPAQHSASARGRHSSSSSVLPQDRLYSRFSHKCLPHD
ncbi:hypothetical protein OJAV_G00035000 [Oryzias javanicus]|uniref:Uncharacterized protein n=1 Tax=Oryzias javanicus TaxID=123683 RepID=A0A3S2Q8Q9_ORYJA|nr:hypothetical protein OJAV_G00035000 [Oryzias javanicus]